MLTCIPHYPKPKVAGVIVTGSKENFSWLTTTIAPRALDTSLPVTEIFAIPLFVIFSPFRNIYSDLSELKSCFSNMDKKIVNMRVHMKIIIAEVSSLRDALIWSAMTLAELHEECLSAGMEVDTALSKAKLLKILLLNSSRKDDIEQEALQPATAFQKPAV